MKKGLKFWRLNADLGLRDAAKILNIHENTLRNWERNPGSVRYVDVLKLAELYGVTPEDIDFSTPKTISEIENAE